MGATIETLERFARASVEVTTEEATWAAHNLSGALGSYGLQEGSQIAQRIEYAIRTGSVSAASLSQEVAHLRETIEQMRA